MKRAFSVATAGALVATIAAAVAAAPSPAPPAKKPAPAKAPAISKFRQHQLDILKVSAPGDEYFGRMKMSYLGINNTFHDDAIRAGLFTVDPGLISSVNFADESLRQWQSKYPRDPQLSRSYWLGFLVYRKIYTYDGQQKAWNYLNLEAQKFPNSFFGKTAKADLKAGFTMHYYATPVPCPSPTPTLMPGAKAPVLTPSPSPSPTESPTPTPPGQPKVEILPVACFTPQPSPSPTPTPTIAPSGSPAPSPSGVTPSPAPGGSPSPAPSGSPSPAPSGSPTPAVSPTPHRH